MRPRPATLVAAGLFVATAIFVVWRNATAGVLWDVAFILNTATRIAAGDVPYRDFPMVQAPLTLVVQAALIKLFGPHFLVQVAYAAVTGGLATVLAFRAARWMLAGRVPHAATLAGALCVPFVFVGINSIHAPPFYGSDAAWTALAALTAVIAAHERPSPRRWILAGVLLSVPVFAKQNVGLALLGSTYLALSLEAAVRPLRRPGLVSCAVGTLAALGSAALILHLVVGLPEYLRWTVGAAAAVRPPQLLSIAWLAHPIALLAIALGAYGFVLARRGGPVNARAGIALTAAPLLIVAALTPMFPPMADLLWAILLSAALLATGLGLTDGDRVSLRSLLPVIVTGVAWGAWLTHGVRGSSRDIWPILALPLAAIVLAAAAATRPNGARFTEATALLLAGTITATAIGYTGSNFALSWVDLDGPATLSTHPSMIGFGTPGTHAADLDELLRWIEREVPADDVVVFVPGEDPVYFALGRRPLVPSVFFDEVGNPFAPEEFARIARAAGLRWVFVKERQQIRTPWLPEDMIRELTHDLEPVARVAAYQVYRRP